MGCGRCSEPTSSYSSSWLQKNPQESKREVLETQGQLNITYMPTLPKKKTTPTHCFTHHRLSQLITSCRHTVNPDPSRTPRDRDKNAPLSNLSVADAAPVQLCCGGPCGIAPTGCRRLTRAREPPLMQQHTTPASPEGLPIGPCVLEPT